MMKTTRPKWKRQFFCLGLFLLLGTPVVYCEQKDDEAVKELMALPYLQGYYPAPENTGVSKYDRGKTFKGYNLYTSCHAAYAALLDMKGNVLHEWSYDLTNLWPDEEIEKPCWEMVHLYENGDLLGIVEHQGIFKVNKNSQLLWSYDCDCHHDLDLDEQGNIYVLDQQRRQFTPEIGILDHLILKLSSEGKFIKRTSLWDLFQNGKDPMIQMAFKRIAGMAKNGREDIFHANTVQMLDGSLADKSPIFQKGNILTCMLTMSSIAIINIEKEEIVWFLEPILWYQGQHFPTLLPNGNILIFDNHYWSHNLSRVFEFEPLTREPVWEYMDKGFYSNTHGTNQRLPNGNTLIAESDKGRVFEVTPDKKIVWEYLNPHKTGENNELIATIQIMWRIAPDDVSSWLGLN